VIFDTSYKLKTGYTCLQNYPFSHQTRWGNGTCNIMENGDAILWENYLQLSPKSSCKKHNDTIKLNSDMVLIFDGKNQIKGGWKNLRIYY